MQVIRPAARRPYDFCLAKPSLNTMPDAYTGYRYVRNKCLVAFVARSLAPPPPDFNVEPAWLEGSGFEVRNKRLVYVKAVVAPKRRFNIEIGGAGGSAAHMSNVTGRFFRTYRYTIFTCYIAS